MANNTYTLLELSKAVTHALGGTPDVNITSTEIVNGAISWISSVAPWRWKQKSATLDSVISQSYITLPTDFEEMLVLRKTSDTTGKFEKVTLDQIVEARQASATVAGTWWAINYRPQASVTVEPTPVLELYPTPSASTSGYLTIIYRRQIPKLSANTDMPDIPSPFHELVKIACRAYAVYYETNQFEADWNMLQTMFPQYERLDGRAEGHNLGRYRGGISPPSGIQAPPTITT